MKKQKKHKLQKSTKLERLVCPKCGSDHTRYKTVQTSGKMKIFCNDCKRFSNVEFDAEDILVENSDDLEFPEFLDKKIGETIDWREWVKVLKTQQNLHERQSFSQDEATIRLPNCDQRAIIVFSSDWHLGCLPPGEYINTKFGIKEIETINKNDLVLGNDGFENVINIMEYDYNDLMYNIKPLKSPSFQLTKEHPVKVYSVEKLKLASKTKKNHKRYIRNKPDAFSKVMPEWKKAEDLCIGDYLIFPKIKNIENIEFIYIPYKNKTYRSNEYASLYFKLKIDELTAFILGLYLAEGWAGKYGNANVVGFAFHEEERDLINKVEEWAYSRFGLIAQKRKQKTKKCMQVIISSEFLQDWFRNNFGHQANEKNIPSFIFQFEQKYQIAFLRGYIAGDGSIFNRTNRKEKLISITTVSHKIVSGVCQLSNIIGLHPYTKLFNKIQFANFGKDKIYKCKPPWQICFYLQEDIKKLDYNDISWKSDFPALQEYEDDDNTYKPITKIDTNHYKGKIYNLETKSNTFCVEGALVHNSISVNYQEFQKNIQLILDTPFVYMITVGDLVDNFRRFNALQPVLSQIANPRDQVLILRSILNEFWEKKKWIASCWGNHDVQRDEELYGQSVVKDELNKNLVYFNGKGILNLLVGEQKYIIRMSHAFKGNSIYNQLHSAMREMRFNFPDADIFVSAHKHSPAIANTYEFGKRKCFIRTGSFELDSGYSKRFWAPGIIGVPAVVLRSDEHSVFAYPSLEELLK